MAAVLCCDRNFQNHLQEQCRRVARVFEASSSNRPTVDTFNLSRIWILRLSTFWVCVCVCVCMSPIWSKTFVQVVHQECSVLL